MAYLHLLPDLGMNYTLNRPLFDGKATSRITKVSAVAPQIEDFFWVPAFAAMTAGRSLIYCVTFSSRTLGRRFRTLWRLQCRKS